MRKSDCVFLPYTRTCVFLPDFPSTPPPPLIQHVAIGSFLLARCSVGRVRAGMPSCTLSLLACSATPEVGVLDEPYSQLSPLSGVAVQARQST